MCFNPRTHEGCDLLPLPCVAASAVSIHAPTRGATHISKVLPRRTRFQSTHPRGVRLSDEEFLTLYTWFQSTHPRGVRHGREPGGCCGISFNPRTHEGCDEQIVESYILLIVSIHAPTRGATQY